MSSTTWRPFVSASMCKLLRRITNPMNQYMLSCPVKTPNTMMDLDNIDGAVLHDRIPPQQVTRPEMSCGVILSVTSITKKKLPCRAFTPLWLLLNWCHTWTYSTHWNSFIRSVPCVTLFSVTWHKVRYHVSTNPSKNSSKNSSLVCQIGCSVCVTIIHWRV